MGKKLSVWLTEAPCSCGGTLKPTKAAGARDISIELGLPARVQGTIPLLRCDRCREISLPGGLLEALADEAALVLLGQERLLSGAEARFLRKTILAVRQDDLAGLMGITRVTVARWETARSLTPQQDFGLRGLLLGHLCKASLLAKRWKKQRARVTALLPILESARTIEAPGRLPPMDLQPPSRLAA